MTEADVCPECGSKNIMVGAFPLQCFACGWNCLNKYQCGVCGAPATSSAGTCETKLYGCQDHPITTAGMEQLMRQFFRAVETQK